MIIQNHPTLPGLADVGNGNADPPSANGTRSHESLKSTPDKSAPLSIVLTEQQWLILGHLLSQEIQSPTLPEEFRSWAYAAALKIQQMINRLWFSELPEHLKGMVVNLAGQKTVSAEYLYGAISDVAGTHKPAFPGSCEDRGQASWSPTNDPVRSALEVEERFLKLENYVGSPAYVNRS